MVPESSLTDYVRARIPAFAVSAAVVAAVTDPSSAADLVLCAIPAGAFIVWTFVPRLPLPALAMVVIVPVCRGTALGAA